MKKRFKKGLNILLASSMVLGLAACGKSGETTTDTTGATAGETTAGNTAAGETDGTTAAALAGPKEEATLRIMMFGNKPNGLDEVLEEFYSRTKDTLNVKLDIEWTPSITDVKEKVKLKMAAGEEYDLLWDAESANMKTLVPQGAYVPMDEYFNNDAYPGLKKCFPAEFIESNKMSGHLYGIPLVQDWGMNVDGTVIRKDLREKYAPDGINSAQDFAGFLEQIRVNEPELIPYAADGAGLRQAWVELPDELKPINSRIYSYSIGGWPFFFRVNETRDEIISPVIPLGAPEEDWKQLGDDVDAADMYYNYQVKADMNKYLEKDVLAQKDRNALFYAGKAACVAGDLGVINTYIGQMKDRGYEIEWVSYHDDINKMVPAALETTFISRNFMCIPVTSKKPERVMEFLNWIFEDQANHDLFELGIEGKHWEAVGDDKYRIPEGVEAATNYSFPWYQLTGTPTYVRYLEGTPERVIAIREYAANMDSYVLSPMRGFFFNNENVKTELAQVSSKGKEIESPLLCGIYENPRAVWEEAYQTTQNIGLETLRAEIEAQLNAFFAAKK